MDASQLVFHNEGGNITAAGYSIDSTMFQQGQPALIKGGGASVSSLLESLKLGELAVPLGLFYLQDLAKKSSDSFNTSVFELYDQVDDESPDVKLVEDSLYDKLLAMVNSEETQVINKKNKITRRKRSSGGAAKKTRGRKH
jgi:hypothetical protein